MAIRLQAWIHKFEEGTGSLLVRAGLALMVMLFATVFFNLAQYKNLSDPEGFDQAQLARNLARGRGFETQVIRPLSLNLVFRQATNVLASVEGPEAAAASPEEDYWISLLQEHHPDLANAPLYPLVLAGVLAANPFGFPNLEGDVDSEVFGPDRWIAIFNQMLFLLAVWLTFRLARTWFDAPVAWLAGAVMIASEVLWRFTLSGQPVMLQMVLFLLLMTVMGSMERRSRNEQAPGKGLLARALIAGLLVGLLALTRYSFLFLLLPVFLMMTSLPYARNGRLAAAATLLCLLLLAPWVARNLHLSGTPFGTAGYALFEDTASFPEDSIQRSANPDFREFTTSELRLKLFRHLPHYLTTELPRFGGSWISGFFLVGLLVPYRNPVLSRLRWFLLVALAAGVLVRALGSGAIPKGEVATHFDPVLATFAPLVFVFGTSLFMTLLDQMTSRIQGIRLPAIGGFCLLFAAPLLLSFLMPVRTHLAFPPYYPQWIQEKASYMGPLDRVMTDIPGAMAWYGDRPAVLWTADYRSAGTGRYRNDFYTIHEGLQPLSGLYFSSRVMGEVRTDALVDWISRTEEAGWEETVGDWEAFILVGILLKNEVPQGFPLKNAPLGIYPELFLVDSEHIQRNSIQSP